VSTVHASRRREGGKNRAGVGRLNGCYPCCPPTGLQAELAACNATDQNDKCELQRHRTEWGGIQSILVTSTSLLLRTKTHVLNSYLVTYPVWSEWARSRTTLLLPNKLSQYIGTQAATERNDSKISLPVSRIQLARLDTELATWQSVVWYMVKSPVMPW